MENLWKTHGKPMENPWKTHVIPVNLLLLQGKIGEAMGFLVEFPGGCGISRPVLLRKLLPTSNLLAESRFIGSTLGDGWLQSLLTEAQQSFQKSNSRGSLVLVAIQADCQMTQKSCRKSMKILLSKHKKSNVASKRVASHSRNDPIHDRHKTRPSLAAPAGADVLSGGSTPPRYVCWNWLVVDKTLLKSMS